MVLVAERLQVVTVPFRAAVFDGDDVVDVGGFGAACSTERFGSEDLGSKVAPSLRVVDGSSSSFSLELGSVSCAFAAGEGGVGAGVGGASSWHRLSRMPR